jgi:hypothetical protein
VTYEFEISFPEIVGWSSLATRAYLPNLQDDAELVEDGSVVDCERRAISRVLGDIWAQLPEDIQLRVREELAKVWRPELLGAFDIAIKDMQQRRQVEREIGEIRRSPGIGENFGDLQ